jgi:hypothetical protein
MKKIVILTLALSLAGCAGATQTALTVATVSSAAPVLAQQLDSVYAYLVQQKAVPDRLDMATQALQLLDKIAPVVQGGAEALTQPGKLDWVQAGIKVALAVAQVIGYVAPLIV